MTDLPDASGQGEVGGGRAALLVAFGELTTPSRLRARGLSLLALPALWMVVFLLLPLLVLVAMAFVQRGAYGELIWSPTLGNFRRLAGFGTFEWSADYLRILGRSAWMATITTILCIGAAYPLAFFVAARAPRSRYLWLTLVIIPFCTNLIIRTYAWMLILSGQLPPARLAQWLGLVPADTALYPGQLAVFLGMFTSSLPFAMLPLYTNVERLDWSIVEAAEDLYAGRVRTFMHGILPQTLPGLAAALILTFIPALGAFVVPDLLGGARTWLVGNLIQQQFGASRDWPFGAAIAIGLMLMSLAGLFFVKRRGWESGLA